MQAQIHELQTTALNGSGQLTPELLYHVLINFEMVGPMAGLSVVKRSA
jgi:hypothetical protein